jgi:hypothetical protein
VTAVDVDALDAARAAATPGYWQLSPDGWTFAVQYENGLGYRVRDADAALIVAAVNALPELLAEVRRGRALREAVEGLAAEWDRSRREGWVPVGRGTEVGWARDVAHAAAVRAVLAAVDAS